MRVLELRATKRFEEQLHVYEFEFPQIFPACSGTT
jgi:hypothetical protein